MAAVAATILSWETARKKRCFRLFVALKCVKDRKKKLNADADDFDITQLDVMKMKTHILDCVAALGIVQQELVSHEQPSILQVGEQSLVKEQQEASNKVFKASLSITASAMLLDGTEPPEQRSSVDMLLKAFPDYSKQVDGRSWLPLHWAAVIGEKSVTEEDVKMIYTSDPMALQRYHRNDSTYCGYTPAHLLCMQDVTQRNMSLIQYFSVCNQQAFSMSASYSSRRDPSPYSFSALHAACYYGQPTEMLLKLLLQLDSSQTKMKCSRNGLTPLGYLCTNSSFSDRLITCMLEVDSSVEVVGNVIVGCLASIDGSCVLERVDMLLKANPEAAKYRDVDGCNLLHLAAQYEEMPIIQLCISIMMRILSIHKDAVQEVDSRGWLPIHTAARESTVEVMEFLLGLYPESASVVTTSGSLNLLHLAVLDEESTTSVMEAKVRLLCSRYPAMLHQRNEEGDNPLHDAICRRKLSAVQILCETGGRELVRVPVVHPTDDNNDYNGWLPLHYLIYWNTESLRNSLLSKEADCFRMFLRWYPEAAGIEGGVAVAVDEEEDEDDGEGDGDDEEDALNDMETPYKLAVDKNLPPYYLRLLLRAAPDLNPAELHRLNYAERRMAMFLAFKAVTSQKKPLLLKRLCFENKDLVKHVMSFL